MKNILLEDINHITSIVESIFIILSTVIGGIVANNKSNITYFLVGIIVSETIAVVALIAYITNIKKKNMIVLKNIIFKIHKEFVHKTRNHMHKLNNIQTEVKELKGDSVKYDEIYTREFEKVKEILQPVVNCISDILSDYLKQNISTCIKIFTLDELKEHPVDRHVTTFVRSHNTDSNRISDDADFIAVKKNTDFKRLCNGKAVFGCGDLKFLHDTSSYENDSDNWQSKYNSSLVVPIRYKPEVSIKKDSKIYILGFICIDSKEKNIQWEDRNCLEVQLLGMFADTIYMYLNDFKNCFLGEY